MARKVRKAIVVNPETSAKFGHKVGDKVALTLANGVGSLVGMVGGAVWGLATGAGKVVADAWDKVHTEDEAETPAVTESPATEEVTLTQAELTALIAEGVKLAQSLEAPAAAPSRLIKP